MRKHIKAEDPVSLGTGGNPLQLEEEEKGGKPFCLWGWDWKLSWTQTTKDRLKLGEGQYQG